MSVKKSNILAMLVFILAMTQFIGGWLGIKSLKGLGASLAMAPYPKVFSDVEGLETFASSFEIYTKRGDYWSSKLITPEVYQKLSGSYNRRNVYGAAISYGPKLPEPLKRQIFNYALINPGSLREELGLPLGDCYVVVIKTKTQNRYEKWNLASTEKEEQEFEKFIAQ